MTHDVRQWLAEIEALRKKLADAEQERDEAFKSAANWRKLYEQEAQQRRAEANLAQQAIDDLHDQLYRLQATAASGPAEVDRASIEQQVTQYQSTETLQQQLVEAIAQCNQLQHALKHEQSEHERTRKTLMDALGDTMNALAKERSAVKEGDIETQSQRPPSESSNGIYVKNPLLELPMRE